MAGHVSEWLGMCQYGWACLKKVHSALLSLLAQRCVAAVLLRQCLELHSTQSSLPILSCIDLQNSAPTPPRMHFQKATSKDEAQGCVKAAL